MSFTTRENKPLSRRRVRDNYQSNRRDFRKIFPPTAFPKTRKAALTIFPHTFATHREESSDATLNRGINEITIDPNRECSEFSLFNDDERSRKLALNSPRLAPRSDDFAIFTIKMFPQCIYKHRDILCI